MTTIKLAIPFKNISGIEIAEVKMRRATVKDLRIMHNSGGTDADKELRLIGNLCELAPDDLDRMDATDYATLQKTLQGFLSPRAS